MSGIGAYEGEIGKDDNKIGLWGFSYDILYKDNKGLLTNEEIAYIVDDLEARLKRMVAVEPIDPWAIEAAALRLADYYAKNNNKENLARVLISIEDAFESINTTATPLQMSAWYERLHDIYMQYQQKRKADQIKRKMLEIGPKVVGDMATFSHTIKMPKEKVDKFLNDFLGDGLENALIRTVLYFIPKRIEVEKNLKDLSSEAPLYFLITRSIVDYKGRPTAKIGSLDEDIESNVIFQISQDMSISSIFLRQIIEEVERRYKFDCDNTVEFLFKSPIFDDYKRGLIKKALEAYFHKDYVVAIHFLIPQIEDAFRNLIAINSGNTLKPNKYGGFQVRTLGDILQDSIISEVFGEDAALYFKVLLVDQRGWNIRNNVCHGLSPINAFNSMMADRLFHVLLILGLIRINSAS